MRSMRGIVFTATAIACLFVEGANRDGIAQRRKGNRHTDDFPFGIKRVTHRTLFAKNENALLAGEAHFLHLAIFSEQHGVVAGLSVAIFPAAFALGDDGLAFLYRGFVAVDQEAVFTGLQISFAEFGGLGDANGLADRLRKNGESKGGYRQ